MRKQNTIQLLYLMDHALEKGEALCGDSLLS